MPQLKAPAYLEMTAAAGDVTLDKIEAADGASGVKTLRKFSMVGYTGVPMRPAGFGLPVVVDLAGLRVPSQSRPILLNHDPERIVGHSDAIEVTAQRLKLSGVISGVGEHVQLVASLGDNGFPWQASMGASIEQLAYVDRGESVNVNGRAHSGPLYVARRAVLGEVSFVPMGADSATSAKVTAAAGRDQLIEVHTMKFEQWLEAAGFKLSELSEPQLTKLRAAHNAEAEKDKPADDPGLGIKATGGDGASEDDDEAAVLRRRKAIAAEESRIGAVKLAAKDFPEIAAKAIGEGWTVEKTELAVVRAERPTGPSIHVAPNGPATPEVIQAAVCLAGKLPGVEQKFKAETLEAAHKHYRGVPSVQRLLCEAAIANGHYADAWTIGADLKNVLRAAFSTLSLPGIFADVANKFILAGFMGVESTWRRITKVSSVKDFKTVHRYRLTGDMTYEYVGPTGEIKHGKLGEQEFTNRAKTAAKMFSITREDIINDDLGALTDVPRMLGRGAALKVCETFWTEFLDNASFFATGNKNYISGSTTNLSVDGLTQLETTFLDQVDPDGKPIAISPRVLLVPNALKTLAGQFMTATQLAYGTADGKPTNNPHAGKWTVESSAYLNNAAFSGGSATAYYLLADPNELPVIETVFLNGREEPVVETADAALNVLGVEMRGYHDFGHKKQEHRGGAKSKGAA